MQNVNFTNIIPFSPLPHLWHTKRYQGSPQDRPCPIPTILREGQETLVDVVKMKMVLSEDTEGVSGEIDMPQEK